MSETETNIISHLLEVETEAESVIDAAQVESSKRILASKASADELFHSKYAELVQRLEAETDEKLRGYSKTHDEELESYKSTVLQTEKDVGSFNSFLDKILFHK